MGEPTARNPWTVTLCWTPDQNYGRVSTFPERSPVRAIWGQLAGGEKPELVADDYLVTRQQVQVLDRLRREAIEGGPTRSEVEAAVVHDDHCRAYGVHRECCGPDECGCTVAEVLNELIERGWLQLAEEPADG